MSIPPMGDSPPQPCQFSPLGSPRSARVLPPDVSSDSDTIYMMWFVKKKRGEIRTRPVGGPRLTWPTGRLRAGSVYKVTRRNR
jgi:hypothetical protein